MDEPDISRSCAIFADVGRFLPTLDTGSWGHCLLMAFRVAEDKRSSWNLKAKQTVIWGKTNNEREITGVEEGGGGGEIERGIK